MPTTSRKREAMLVEFILTMSKPSGTQLREHLAPLHVRKPYMKLRLPLLLICAALLAPFATAQTTAEPTIDQLVAKNVHAKGGAEALRALQSLRLSGKLLVNQGQMELGYSQTKKRPGSVRTELSLQGMTVVQAYDGSQAWQISPFQGRKDPEKMSADDAKPLIEGAEIDGPLVDWKEKGSTLEYLGTEDVDGTAAHKVKVVRKSGDTSYVYLDPDHFLEIRTVTQRVQRGAKVEIETDIGDYEKIAGVFLPFSIESAERGSSDKQKTIIEKAEPNVSVEDAIFSFPVTAAK